jgi:hypothetical protein
MSPEYPPDGRVAKWILLLLLVVLLAARAALV